MPNVEGAFEDVADSGSPFASPAVSSLLDRMEDFKDPKTEGLRLALALMEGRRRGPFESAEEGTD